MKIDSVVLDARARERLLPAGSDDKCEGVNAGSIGALGSKTTEELVTRTAEK